jgi:hypothetical protein
LFKEGDQWTKDVIEVTHHAFLSDTDDGGLAGHLLEVGGKTPKFYETDDESAQLSTSDVEAKIQKSKAVPTPSIDAQLTAKCRCGGVDLRILRADFAERDNDIKEHYSYPIDKYVAGLCACRSCRLHFGTSLVPWAYIPVGNVSVASTGKKVVFGHAALDFGTNPGTTLKHKETSKGVIRSWCGSCGASVFFWSEERKGREEVVDISGGILRAESGVMAREWLEWRDLLSYDHEGTDQALVRQVKKSIEAEAKD